MALPPFVGGFQPFLRNNSDMLLAAGTGLLSGQTPQQQTAGLAQGVGAINQRNRTAAKLRASGATDLADAIESGQLSGTDAFKLFYAQKLEAEKPRNNLIPVGKNLYDFQNGEWIAPPAGIAANDVEAGLNLVYGKDKAGNTIAFQPLKSGGLRQVEVPEGASLTPGISNLDLGTSILTLNNRTGAPVANTPKDVVGAARDAKIGGAQGEAEASIPAAQQTANDISSQITSLKNDPDLSLVVGPVAGRTPNLSANSQRVQSKIAQLQGGAFLAARQMLKGGGQITDYEGRKAEEAIARMNQAQSVQDFQSALDDFNYMVQSGVKKLQAAAGQQQQQAPVGQQAPSGGGVVDYSDYFKSGGL